MKKKTLKWALTVAVGSFLLASCSQESHDHAHGEEGHNHDHVAHAGYQCPMQCEGDKIHKEPGKCSVCEMKLEEVKK